MEGIEGWRAIKPLRGRSVVVHGRTCVVLLYDKAAALRDNLSPRKGVCVCFCTLPRSSILVTVVVGYFLLDLVVGGCLA